MGYSVPRHWPFSIGLAARGLVSGCLAAGGSALALSGRPVLGLILWALAIAGVIALVRSARRAERVLREFVEMLAGGADDRPAPLPRAFADLDAAMARALAAMRARETTYDAEAQADFALLDTVPAALFVTDADGRLIRSNRAARAMAPTAPARFADHPLFTPDEAAALLADRVDAGRMLRLADGRAAHVSVTLFERADGTRQRLIAVQAVSEQLGALETDAWHRLSRVLAHEMMNSLSPVISLAETLASLARDPAADPDRIQTHAAATTIARRAQHLLNFVDRYRQWLAIPRPEAASVDLPEFAGEIVSLARGFDPRVPVRLRERSPGRAARFDRELVEQALLNLLKNAVEAAGDASEPSVTLDFEVDDHHVRFTVEDNGAGLPEDTGDVFLPFYTTKAKGAGIGLAIARQIAEAHGGYLAADRRVLGAAFSMRLPLVQ